MQGSVRACVCARACVVGSIHVGCCVGGVWRMVLLVWWSFCISSGATVVNTLRALECSPGFSIEFCVPLALSCIAWDNMMEIPFSPDLCIVGIREYSRSVSLGLLIGRICTTKSQVSNRRISSISPCLPLHCRGKLFSADSGRAFSK